MALFGLAGLLIASRAADATFYSAGLIFSLASVLTIFNLIRITFDEAEGRPTEREGAVPFVLLAIAVGSVLFHAFSPWWWAPIASNWHYIDETIRLTFWITGLVFVAVLAFVAYCVFRFRHREGSRAEYGPESTRLELVLAIGTAVGVAAMLAPGLVVWGQFITAPTEATEVEAVGQQWSWNFRLAGQDGRLGTTDIRDVRPVGNPLGVSPDDPHGQDDIVVEAADLHLLIGRPVKLRLRAIDVLHSFYVPEFRAKMDLVPGMVTQLWFTPTRPGRFQILCAELCGFGHPDMRGWVVVENERDYRNWLQAQQTFAQRATSAVASSLHDASSGHSRHGGGSARATP
ncbi:cytochrome c oxidase subunit II [Roseomonas sp. M0104]|uniref:cytochrome-c oxidase n=2 Tax=Teichococcus coralli TaxID=2545983 RepID=A0A845BIY2_9PROT|nr:cytochrome c oxidase subunit II [Pseudoroseomonas coralli]MXP66136.1 cytochrome c oxidase subunit II [Pseudoroseomonas coralli]